jgi:hypothetical protein
MMKISKIFNLRNDVLLKQTEKIEEATAFTCKQHSLIIYLKEKKRRCWLKMIVLNHKKFNQHFKIKIYSSNSL